MTAPSAREINETVRYTLWAIVARESAPKCDSAESSSQIQGWIDALKIQDIEVRGIYDVSGMREDADLMIWLHGPTAEGLQYSLRDFRRTTPGSATHLAWSIMALHRPAEFNKGHVPAYMAGKDPKGWLCIYPFNRSYEWYLLPEEERRDMLIEHGMKGRSYPGILSNTVSTFALNDFEWVLALESDELTDLVDLMRDMRYTNARRHVREEIPFYTGRRVDAAGAAEVLA